MPAGVRGISKMLPGRRKSIEKSQQFVFLRPAAQLYRCGALPTNIHGFDPPRMGPRGPLYPSTATTLQKPHISVCGMGWRFPRLILQRHPRADRVPPAAIISAETVAELLSRGDAPG